MLEQFNELRKQSNLKPNLSLFQSHRMHLGTFTQVCVKIFSTKFYKNKSD
jgi:hypothetical protein